MKTEIIMFDGIDGSGKDTVIRGVYNYLKSKNYDVLLTREPGGSEVAEEIREIILDPSLESMEPETEAMLYAASRFEHVVKKILPAIGKYDFIIMSRYIASSIAYQGYGRHLGSDYINTINKRAKTLINPDIKIYLDLSYEESKQRVDNRGEKDRLEQEKELFFKNAIKGYKEQDDLIEIDASNSEEKVLIDTIDVILKESKVLI